MIEFDTIQQLEVHETSDKETFRESVIRDFWICCVSREVSLLGRREVLTGKAKFGILGDGKEVPQVALAKSCRPGDWRSGYYRDQTMMFALGIGNVEDYFAQLYADAENDPYSGGRQMNAHFSTPTIDSNGEWKSHMSQFNVSADMSPTAGQMSRALGIGLASKYYRQHADLAEAGEFSSAGNEISICTIGDASTSEGVFWETMNAAAVQQVPLAVCVWDDGYGISVPRELQTVKSSISEALKGFSKGEGPNGIDIYKCKAWDYPALCAMFEKGLAKVRETHTPALFHIEECTQPQGHSTSGSHERYKSQERLSWESTNDGIRLMGEWMVESGICDQEQIDSIRERAVKFVRKAKQSAWKKYTAPVIEARGQLAQFYGSLEQFADHSAHFNTLKNEFDGLVDPGYAEVLSNGRKLYYSLMHIAGDSLDALKRWIDEGVESGRARYNSHLLSSSTHSALGIPVVHPEYEESGTKPGHQILNQYFDTILSQDKRVLAFGEDVGKIGGVNQGFAGMQEKHGDSRVFDAGIREWTIVGQAIGMAMRGLRPIAEIQYLDYLVYALTPLTDDLATIRYRSNGTQQAPAIIRTRGHRLEGIWHAGSPMGMIVNALRGIHVCVPRNMVQAVGMYNTLMQSDDPAVVIECLNGYRRREDVPSNIGEYTVPLGAPDVIREGHDCTIISYGSVLHEVMKAAELLDELDISVEVVDVQTLLPFDLEHTIKTSLARTSRVVFVDEDVPGGGTAFMMHQVLQIQGGYELLDAAPVCVTSNEHRPPYGSDGDYFSKPSSDDVLEAVYKVMHEADPTAYPVRFS